MELTAGTKAVVLGLGTSGLAVLRYLQSRGLEVAVSEFRSDDDLSDNEKAVCRGLAFETGGHSEKFVLSADLVVPSPGVPLDLDVLKAARERGIPIVGELALAAGEISVPVIAVTGSNGKTTVTGLIGELLQSSGFRPFVGGNIGKPLLSYLFEAQQYDVVVLELSSFQLDLSGAFRPDVGLLLNLSPDHLDRHGDMASYTRAKQRIFCNQEPGDTAILGGDDPLVMESAPGLSGRVYTFGYGPDSEARIVEDRVIVTRDGREDIFELKETRLNSRVNRLNAAAAILAAGCVGADSEGIRKGLSNYTPPQNRMTPVAEINGVWFINDSKATNVGAMAAALESCPSSVILLAGGRDKGGDFSAIRELVREKVETMLCIGEAAKKLVNTFSDVVAVEEAKDMAAAVDRA
ncbi:MAG: UDP-N-acetylmuramoyl-L-alanine--D-glutamate ligase, partial [Desulfobulbaceae bacterium]|nr:UDP-N-acetylmuramoyl-L-alanine--D-glutamate ligase [Desulfobulbaceae bacterium]